MGARTRIGGPSVAATLRTSRSRVLLGVADLGLQQEVLDFLDRDPRIDVIGAASEPHRLMELVASASPDTTVVCPFLARDIRHPAVNGRTKGVLVVTEEMNVAVLRDAIEAGARGVFSWPEERGELARTISELPDADPTLASERARVVAVYGARGGAGATFIATHLAAGLADRGRRCALVDLDAGFADLTVALGVHESDEARTIADLIPVAGELSLGHLDDALHRHPRGFGVLLGPSDGRRAIPAKLYREAVALLAGAYERVVLHLPRAQGGETRTGVDMADLVLLVATLDLFSLYGARRAISSLGLEGTPNRWHLVINRRTRSSVSARDVRRVLGVDDWTEVRHDPAVRRAQDRGELLRARGRHAGRDLSALQRLLEELVESSSSEARGRP